MVDTNVSVLTTGGVCGTGGVNVDGVKGTEMATNAADFIFENLGNKIISMLRVRSIKTLSCTHSVVESGLEFTLAGGGGGNIHGGLTTTKNDEVLLGCHGSSVERGIGDIGFEDGEVAG